MVLSVKDVWRVPRFGTVYQCDDFPLMDVGVGFPLQVSSGVGFPLHTVEPLHLS